MEALASKVGLNETLLLLVAGVTSVSGSAIAVRSYR